MWPIGSTTKDSLLSARWSRGVSRLDFNSSIPPIPLEVLQKAVLDFISIHTHCPHIMLTGVRCSLSTGSLCTGVGCSLSTVEWCIRVHYAHCLLSTNAAHDLWNQIVALHLLDHRESPNYFCSVLTWLLPRFSVPGCSRSWPFCALIVQTFTRDSNSSNLSSRTS